MRVLSKLTVGGMDFSPILLFLVIGGVQRYLVPAFFGFLHGLVGAPVICGRPTAATAEPTQTGGV